MRAGDWLLAGLVALTLGVIAADRLSGGAVQAWIASDLSATARIAGQYLGWVGWALAPIVALPAIAAVWTFIGAPPALVYVVLARIAGVVDAINRAIGDMVRWFASGAGSGDQPDRHSALCFRCFLSQSYRKA